MPRNIILLSDGTGNSAAKLFKSNVWRLYQAIDLSNPNQIACYDDGVGTSSFKPLSLLGGAFGWGLKRNVLDLYTFLCRNYQEGDRIYCLGFSRGAFTIRVLAGLILTQGLVYDDSELKLRKLAITAYRSFYREHFSSALRLEVIGRAIRDLFFGIPEYQSMRKSHPKPDIHFLGLWDTVAAYGLPIDELTRAWNWVFPLSIPDREPSKRVHRICHAVAIDDERNTFHPVLFNEENLPPGHNTATNIRQEKVTQVWFSGMHSNVGGGYPDDALAYVPLNWMLGEAGAEGLILKASGLASVRESMDPLGKLYDSRRGAGGLYRYLPRRMNLLINDVIDSGNRVVIQRPKIHESVLQRIKGGVDRYAPIVLPERYAIVQANGDIVDHADETPDQAKQRHELQERIWDLVWWKRVAYFSSIVTALLLLVFPILLPPTEVCETRTCFLSAPIGWLGSFLPASADGWLTAYQSHPSCFVGLVAIFFGLLRIGDRIQGRIGDKMNRLWEHTRKPGTQVANFPKPGGFPYVLRTNRLYQAGFRVTKRFILPLLAGLAVIVAALQVAGRLAFLIASSGGFVCTDSQGPLTTSPVQFQLETKAVCTGSGFEATRGKRYEVKIDITEGWKDATLPATVQGVTNPTTFMSLATLSRRSLRQPWFKPLMRIGSTAMDEYPINGVGEYEQLTAEFTARRTGEVFLYVNDAVLPFPQAGQYFYNNNHGSARVTIREKPAN
jgi:uncharacterized protein (DUF2235 family)